MAEAVLDWPAIFEAIKDEISSVQKPDGSPAFDVVRSGEPWAPLVGVTWCAFWYGGRGPATKSGGANQTFGNNMYAAHIEVMGYWPIPLEQDDLPRLDAEIATADTGIRRAMFRNPTINSRLTDLDIEPSQVSYANFPYALNEQQRGLTFRALRMDMYFDNLEGERILPDGQ